MNRHDLILFISILLIILFLFVAYHFFFRSEGSMVEVQVNGIVQGRYSLHSNQSIEIKGIRGSNLLVIEDGAAYMESATCPDKICVHHTKISHSGESIVCLPNKVVVTVTGNPDSGSVDAVSQ